MTILFMGSGPFGLPALERLHALEHDSVSVATVPDAPRGRKGTPAPTVIKERAMELGLDCHEVETLKGEHGVQLMETTGARLVIVADFRLMLTRRFLALPERHCYNLHGSILPRFRGAAPVARAVLAGDRIFGVTLYQMVRALDAGPVVAVTEHCPEGLPTAGELEEVLARKAADLLEVWLPCLLHEEVPLVPQDDAAATLAPKLQKNEGWVNWEHDGQRIRDKVRAMQPWPRTFSDWQRAAVDAPPARVFFDEVADDSAEHEALQGGTVRALDGAGIHVACGPEGRRGVIVRRLQRAGKRALTAEEFLRGQPLKVGDRFCSPKTEMPS